MASLVYELTADGVYVQTNHTRPKDEEWEAMLAFVHEKREQIRWVVVTGKDGATPTVVQRQHLAVVIGELSPDVKTALLVDSKFARGALRALNWLTGRGDRTKPFPRAGLEEALMFLGPPDEAKQRVRETLDRQRQPHTFIDGASKLG